MTRLENFLKLNGIKPAHLEYESGISRQHILRIRLGTAEPTRRTMVALRNACQRLLRRRVRVTEMFDLGDGEK